MSFDFINIAVCFFWIANSAGVHEGFDENSFAGVAGQFEFLALYIWDQAHGPLLCIASGKGSLLIFYLVAGFTVWTFLKKFWAVCACFFGWVILTSFGGTTIAVSI